MTIAFITSFEPKSNVDSMELCAITAYFGNGVSDVNPVLVVIVPGDTLFQVKQKLIEAVLTQASILGYSVTASDIILPTFQKGA